MQSGTEIAAVVLAGAGIRSKVRHLRRPDISVLRGRDSYAHHGKNQGARNTLAPGDSSDRFSTYAGSGSVREPEAPQLT